MDKAKQIYLDYQATTPIDPVVLSAITDCYSKSYGNPHSSEHWAGWQANNAVEAARLQLAKFINADSDEIYFTSGATESNNLALLGCLRHYLGPRKRVFFSATEHKSLLSIANYISERLGFQTVKIPVDNQGVVDLDWLDRNVNEETLLVSVLAVNNEIGTIQPLTEISKITRAHGAIFHTDAAQAPLATQMDVFSQGIDILSLSCHKIYGPKGIGAIYIRRDLQKYFHPIILGGGQENGLRGGTLPVPLCVGFGIAIKILQNQFKEEHLRVSTLRNLLFEKLQEKIRGLELNGPPWAARHPGNLNISIPEINAQDLIAAVQPRLAISSGSACSSGIIEPSYVLREIGCSYEKAQSSVRISIGRMTTEEDIYSAVDILLDSANRLREP